MALRKIRPSLLLSVTLLAAGMAPPALNMALAQGSMPMAASRLNPNTATADQLKSISLLNADLIAQIQQGRPYATIGDFNKAMTGKLGDEQLKELYTQLFVPINLNTASREDIALIPGMSSRMIREFLEYRPYSSMDQFNREIGKYVDEAEVKRLASYVTLQ